MTHGKRQCLEQARHPAEASVGSGNPEVSIINMSAIFVLSMSEKKIGTTVMRSALVAKKSRLCEAKLFSKKNLFDKKMNPRRSKNREEGTKKLQMRISKNAKYKMQISMGKTGNKKIMQVCFIVNIVHTA